MREPEYRGAKAAFTLTELLAVMAVMALLAAVLLPVLAQARRQARQIACLSNLRQLGQAHRLYLQDWDDRFPRWEVKSGLDQTRLWTESLRPYLHTMAILRDPAGTDGAHGQGWHYPNAEYALCAWGPGGSGTPQDPYYHWPGPAFTAAQVMRPAGTIVLGDGWAALGWTVLDGWSQALATPDRRPRHGPGLNACFLDGHARWLPAAEEWRQEVDAQGCHWLHYAMVDQP